MAGRHSVLQSTIEEESHEVKQMVIFVHLMYIKGIIIYYQWHVHQKAIMCTLTLVLYYIIFDAHGYYYYYIIS